MSAAHYDLTIEQGATYSVRFEWREDDGSSPPSGPLMDVTGYTPHMQIKTQLGGDVLATFTLASGLSASAGVVELHIGADVTAALPRGGVYDIELHNTADATEVIRLVQGAVELSREVTTV